MKKLTALAITILATTFCFSQNVTFGNKSQLETENGLEFKYSIHWYGGTNNILIGVGAGSSFTRESYCVIVGSDSAAISVKGKDMIWSVDWNEPYLCAMPKVKELLCDYYNKYVLTGKDAKEHRITLNKNVTELIQQYYPR